MNVFHSLIYFLSNFLRNKTPFRFTCSTIIVFCNPNQIQNSSNRNPQDSTRMAYQLKLVFSFVVGTVISTFSTRKLEPIVSKRRQPNVIYFCMVCYSKDGKLFFCHIRSYKIKLFRAKVTNKNILSRRIVTILFSRNLGLATKHIFENCKSSFSEHSNFLKKRSLCLNSDI